MGESREEYEARVSEEAAQFMNDRRDEQRKFAEENRVDEADRAETEEEYRERVDTVRRTMIFGDVDTTAGVDATQTDVPTADNEGATVAVAEADAAAQAGDEEAGEASTDEARRQTAVDAGLTDSAEEADAGAEAADESADAEEGDVAVSQDQEAQVTAEEKVRRIQESDDRDEVARLADGDERVTVQRAADKRLNELS